MPADHAPPLPVAWRRNTASSSARGTAGATPWWRQMQQGFWPHVIVSAGDGMSSLDDETIRIVSGLWRLGAKCELRQGLADCELQ